MRISELKSYSQQNTSNVPEARQVAYAGAAAAAVAVATRRSYTNGLAMSETGPRSAPTQLNGLGELVQVVY